MAQHHTVLVVDDDPQVCRMAADALEAVGYTVVTAHSGQAALALLQTFQVHLILLDVVMPGMSGREFLHYYRSLPKGDAPVIVVSGAARPIELAARIAADGFVAKPFDLAALCRTVDSHLGEQPSAEAA